MSVTEPVGMGGPPAEVSILYVDDDRDFADLTATFLEREAEAFTVETAPNATEGLERLAEDDFDCIVSDYEMPGMDGLKFLEAVRTEYTDFPFVLFTGKGSEEVASEAIRKGATDYLQKKTDTGQYALLANRVENVVEQYRANQRAADLDRIRSLVNEINQALVRATDREEITTTVCQIVSEPDPYQCAWFGAYDPATEAVERRTFACDGDHSSDVSEIDPEVVGHGDHPAAKAVRTRELAVVQNLLENATDDDWHAVAQERGYRSCAAIPLEYTDTLYGVLTVYADRSDIFDDRERDLLVELGDDIAHAIHSQEVQRKRREERNRVIALFENTPDPVVEVSFDGDTPVIDGINVAFEEEFGFDATSVIGRDFADVLVPETEREQFHSLRDEVVNGSGVEAEVRRHTVDGARNFLVRVIPFDSDGSKGAYVWLTDITDRKHRKQDLQRERDRYSAIFEAMPDPIAHVRFEDREPIVKNLNDAFSGVFGYESQALEGDSLNEAIVPDDQRDQAHEIDKSFDTSEEIEGEIERLAADGRRTFLFRASRIELPDGTREGVGVYTDITDRKEHEQALAALHEAATDIEAADTEADVYETLTEVADEILDFALVAVDIVEDDALIQKAWTLDDTGEYYEETPLDEDTLATRTYHQGETIVADDLRNYDITPADPEYLSALTVPIGEYGTFQTVSRELDAFDETDQELAELLVGHAKEALHRLDQERSLREQRERLRRENERLDQFASVVSHDLRNPLTVANGELELAAMECESDHLEEVATSLDRMEAIIDDVLAMARGGQAVEQSELDRVDLQSLAETCWTTVDTGDSALNVDTTATLVGDGDRLRRVLENLFRNAKEHTETPVTITVGDIDENGFYVADDGPGIPEPERDRVFHSGYSTTETGTGFGLAIVQELVEAHDWDVRVTDSDDGGARFEITNVTLDR
jgi:PAS domain S-box-containing protein